MFSLAERRGVIVCYEVLSELISLVGSFNARKIFINFDLGGEGGSAFSPIPEKHLILSHIDVKRDIVLYNSPSPDEIIDALSLADVGFFVVLAMNDDIENKYIYRLLGDSSSEEAKNFETCFPIYLRLFKTWDE